MIQQIRLDLCIPPDQDEDCDIPFNLTEDDLKYPQISQLVHFKLIVTSLAKDRKHAMKKKKDYKTTYKSVVRQSMDLIFQMPSHRKGAKFVEQYKFKNIANPIKRASIVGNYAQIFRSLA